MLERGDINRRDFLKRIGVLACGSAAGLLGLAAYEPHELSIEHVDLRLRGLSQEFDGLRVAQLSDIHFEEFVSGTHLAKAIAAINEMPPDLVVLTGDFVTDPLFARDRAKAAQAAYPCAEMLRKVQARHGVFAVLGNHDYIRVQTVSDALGSAGIPVLRNDATEIRIDGRSLWIVGLDDALRGNPDAEVAFHAVRPGQTAITLIHEPDFADLLQRYPIALQLSGHSHGGQVRFPILGAPYLPRLSRRYPMGHYRVGTLDLYTNRGLGVIGVPFRFMCPPELTLFTLHSMAAD